MESNFSFESSRHFYKLVDFRRLYLDARDSYSRRSTKVNIPELAVLIARGGTRVPYWIRSLIASKSTHERPFQEITKQLIFEHYLWLTTQIRLHRIVPRTKAEKFALYLAGEVCATAESLIEFIGLANSTAHRWLQRAAKAGLLDEFRTDHEVYYLQPKLLQLALVGNVDPDNLFTFDYRDQLAQLRARRHNWLQTSNLVIRFPNDYRKIAWQVY